MKKLLYFLMFLTLGINCFSQEQELLPDEPWKEIIEINNSGNNSLKKWSSDIYVVLEGNYTKKDSLNTEKVLKKLDALTETISIKFSKFEEPNLKINFLDTFTGDILEKINRYSIPISSQKKQNETSEIFVKSQSGIPDSEFKKSLEYRIVKLLVGGYFAPYKANEKRPSIFNLRIQYNEREFSLNFKDMSIIKEVYKTGFEERLTKAEKQFKDTVLKKIEDDRISSRDRNLWWVKNPIAVLFLPVLILVLLALFLINKANKTIGFKIKKESLRFGFLALIALLFAGIIIVFCVSFYDFLTIPDDYTKVPIIRKDTIISTIAALLPLFPLFFLFRFIEFKIQKSSKNVFIKTILVFLSTGLLPFLCIVVAFLFALRKKGDLQGGLFFMSNVFLVLMSVASLRALISYFIFKERNIIIENDKKLANLRELKAKAELKSLQSQINPHFLYNSLNSIASLAPIDAQKTQKMAHSLSDLFKYSINRKGKKTSTILDEVTMVKTYLDIEKIRFGDRLQFRVEVDKALENMEIPLFLIQPLVENAVKHGISQNEGEGKIILKISKEKNEIHISVSDNGPDFPEGLVSGHGLQTVFDLLRLSFGDKASLNWTNTPEKIITITIPETK